MFKPLVIFFGLTNSPATFQIMMNNIFRDLINRGHVIIYLDDVLIFTEIMEEQCQLVKEVLELLWQHKLYLKLKKCDW
jgi:Reverse transcriptase (RNA-dependent DNA polymerase)